MPTSPEVIAQLITEATTTGFREDLLAKGQARAMIWRNGVVPPEAPQFSTLLTYDLLSYAYSLMNLGLRLLDQQAEFTAARRAFEHAASAIEAATSRGRSTNDRDFHRLIAGACYHLARYAARAFSLLHEGFNDANFSVPERAVALLMLRDLTTLEALIGEERGTVSEDEMIAHLEVEGADDVQTSGDADDELSDEPLLQVVDRALTDNFTAALAIALLAFENGDEALIGSAVDRLNRGLFSAAELNMVPSWWCHRLTIHLLKDMWSSSFHVRLPKVPDDGAAQDWGVYRELFIASLLRRGRAEIDLWPSQIDAAARALNLNDNMVVSLPTSAGKTRVAELCILACLAAGRRVVFVTPLRALSAQTEVTLQRTFQPLGKTVSSLYGAIGVSDVDEDFLRESDIIVATPEKLDFALRNDPNLLDTVGLVVLDEGHMIGLTEREVRYEVQIQRLLRRSDAKTRRIVCLSAILPDGDQLQDFAAWLTGDQDDGLIKMDWRPTRLRYGEVEWRGNHAKLEISVGAEKPFVPRFIKARLPKGRKTRFFPCDQRELCIATAWAMVADRHSVLIFCPQRRSVEPFAKAIVDLAKRGSIVPVLDHDPVVLDNAIAIGTEWLGVDSPVLACLRLGVAIHHGALPTPYRKEVERLLRDGILRVTVSSPTLAQGLNLSATTLIFHGLKRGSEPIDIAEFRNVVGRAGRAYVDVEGLVLMPMYDRLTSRRAEWKVMVDSAKGKEMESGLLRLLLSLMGRIVRKTKAKTMTTVLEYLAGVTAWEFPVMPTETSEMNEQESGRWSGYLTTLDTALLSMLGEQEVPDDQIEAMLDDVLTSSLWTRRLQHRSPAVQKLLKSGLVARAKFIWARTTASQRRGYFLAGVGLATGEALDADAAELNELLVRSNGAILIDDAEEAIASITAFAKKVFAISPFAPDDLPDDWPAILNAWLKGRALAPIAAGREDEVLKFVEQALVYKLPWAMEAVRVRGLAHRDVLEGGLLMEDVELGLAVGAVETGSLNISAAMLMHAGFSSRLAAISAVSQTNADFTTMSELRAWLREDTVANGREDPDWPTIASHGLWLQFIESMAPERRRTWASTNHEGDVEWDSVGPPVGSALRLVDSGDQTLVYSADFKPLGRLVEPLNPGRLGLALASVGWLGDTVDVRYLGPEDLLRS
ncbi:DEAD/DEAH box helicase [Sphingorhabdus lacus]|uniref:DEAD/DEAH box helicase n=1 Tax=Sphingorhabdus lacus TaxID=392610 RepID=A0A6I6L4D8_9SPHN|nr:DEAD/DEAH box helicase [Sphingorhabdus lacus]QGY79218.1 DEAD/DEAH box helicase [Sphingorhabdus lacus]